MIHKYKNVIKHPLTNLKTQLQTSRTLHENNDLKHIEQIETHTYTLELSYTLDVGL